MEKPVVERAEGQKVRSISRPTILPMSDVMHVQPPGLLTPRNAAPTVSLLDHTTGAIGHCAVRPADADRCPARLEDGANPGIAAEVLTEAAGKLGPEMQVPADDPLGG